MDKIIWCFGVKNGLEIVEPNKNLAQAYIKKAEDALESMHLVKSKDWIVSIAYYSMYFSLYAIMMRVGIKCGIHSCSLEFMKHQLKGYFNDKECEFLTKSMQARIDKQYYTNRDVRDTQYEEMRKKVPLFLVKCKEIIEKMTEEEIGNLRSKLKELQKGLEKEESEEQ